MRLLIMGPPGAGKGTQSLAIAEHYGIPAISTGDMFRAMRTSESELARHVRQIMADGGYIGDDITNAMVAERLDQPDAEPGFLLDGYPRTLVQVESLDKLLADHGHALDAVISLTADPDEIVARLTKRAEIEGREDDSEEAIRTRQQVYADQTSPLLEVYAERGLLVEVDGIGEVDEVRRRIFTALDTHQTPAAAH
ncbi:adenylate kinase [Friedmanniella endophytica]|uniref:Adenylate kinase n=1 Tax=Microlunatus kandeliicorticis TaxID=1759536 RepID=A0A7W3IQ00_9ACTN|nr:adenylate kinase [Microlunatus kandeliicorticis]MBA8793116.1 adenylate kinase [Microlunatus kandeliicorticis]